MNGVLADPVEETRRIVAAAGAAGVQVRAVGGIAVALRAPSISKLHPPRSYHDIDLAAPARAAALTRVLVDLGYEPARRFNTLNGSERLLFHDPGGRRLDVFVDTLRMCHELRFGARLELDAWTLSPADLALSKLQIVELTERDAQDLAALFADQPLMDADDAGGIAQSRIREVCAADWGWWKTVDGNLARLAGQWRAQSATADPDETAVLRTATERATELRATLDACRKSARWRVRSGIGSRLRWYDLPEDVR